MLIDINIEKKLEDFVLKTKLQTGSKRLGILGASGCGKSMTLKAIAGIEKPDIGKIVVNDRVFFDSKERVNLKPQDRQTGYLFQNYALFPTMSVEQNIAAGLMGKCDSTLRQRKVDEMISLFHLDGLEKRYPSQLSGGQQQRVALARILILKPELILLDEPFSAMDGYLKDSLIQELTELIEGYEGSLILVSHSRDEIYRLCDEVAIMDEGRILVQGLVKDVFQNPQYEKAARLSGCKNILKVQRVDEHTIALPAWGAVMKMSRQVPEGTVMIGIRAHDLRPARDSAGGRNLEVKLQSKAELPFERQLYFYPKKAVNAQANEFTSNDEYLVLEKLAWFIQRDSESYVDFSVPEYLELPEEAVMFLQ